MAETYCGKMCKDCIKYQRSVCAGCKKGPGKTTNPQCEIARCCITRDFSTCNNCPAKNTCVTLNPKSETENMKSTGISSADRVLRIFRLNIATIVIGVIYYILSGLDVLILSLLPLVLVIAFEVIISINFIKLGTLNRKYTVTGILGLLQPVLLLANAAFTFITILAVYSGDASMDLYDSYDFVWEFFITLLLVVQIRFEYFAHSEVTAEYSYSSDDKWRTLFILKIISEGAELICEYWDLPLMAGLSSAAIVVTNVFYLVYLYKMAGVLMYNKSQYLEQNT